MDRAVRESYRAYVTDALVAPVLGSVPRWYDSVHPRAADARTGDEIARDVMCRAGLELVE